MNQLIQGGGSGVRLLFDFEGVCVCVYVCVCKAGKKFAVNDNHGMCVRPPKESLEMHLAITMIGWVDG